MSFQPEVISDGSERSSAMAHGYGKGQKYRGGGDRSARNVPRPSKVQTPRTHGTVKTKPGKK